MPRNPSQGHVGEAFERRTELAIKLAHDWMSAMNMTQRGLSRRLDVDQSVLSRFLSKHPGYGPGPKRPRILKLLEDIEQFCTHVEDVNLWEEDGLFNEDDDLRVWARAHTLRLRHLRQSHSSGESLVRVSELAAQAVHFPMPYKPYTCVNTELAISIALYREFHTRSSSDKLVLSSMRRVDQLEKAILDSVVELDVAEDVRTSERAKGIGFAASARGYAGLMLGDGQLVQRARDGFLGSVALEHQPSTRLWHNALHFIEVLLSRSYEGASEWSCMAAEVAMKCSSESLRVALADKDLEHLRSHWMTVAPRRWSNDEVQTLAVGSRRVGCPCCPC